MVTIWSPAGAPLSSVKLTKRAVDAAQPGPGRYFLWDSELRGFGLRVAQTGTKTYVVRYRPRGVGRGAPKRFVVIGRHGPATPEQARTRAKTILGEVAAGKDPAKASDANAAVTVSALVDLFVSEHAKAKRKPRTAAGYEAALRGYLVPKLGKRPAVWPAAGLMDTELS